MKTIVTILAVLAFAACTPITVKAAALSYGTKTRAVAVRLTTPQPVEVMVVRSGQVTRSRVAQIAQIDRSIPKEYKRCLKHVRRVIECALGWGEGEFYSQVDWRSARYAKHAPKYLDKVPGMREISLREAGPGDIVMCRTQDYRGHIEIVRSEVPGTAYAAYRLVGG